MRRYTGFTGDNGRITPGLQVLIDHATFLTSQGLWNNGAYAQRPMRDKTAPSVHGTGRAVDLSWRKIPAKKKGAARGFGQHAPARQFIDFLIDHQELLLLELVIDYHPQQHGAAWRCDRNTWVNYNQPTVTGGGTGDWFHLEIAPRRANDPDYYKQAFRTIFATS